MTRRLLGYAALLIATAALTSCGSSGSAGRSVLAGPTRTPAPSLSPTPSSSGPPHFHTPVEAMRYLAAAWNHNDLTSLKHVTDPSARDQLNAMHSEAVDLQLQRCVKQPAGDYQCFFSHHFPAAQHKTGLGSAAFLVGPADTPGWYMTVFQYCG